MTGGGPEREQRQALPGVPPGGHEALAGARASGGSLRWASGFRSAMHDTCIDCHKKERDRVSRPDLAECSTCHEELRQRQAGQQASLLALRLTQEPG